MRKDVFPMAGEAIPAERSAFEKGVLTRNLRADLSLGCLNIQEGGKRSLCWSVKHSTKRERSGACYASKILLRKASASVMCLITNSSTESLKMHKNFADTSIWLKYNTLRSFNGLFFVSINISFVCHR
ncbi:hypothetical protein CDAR_601971 [Caerostris darwini]|uniref:Uncharacterized protein n=1 Tax=Caerostris darwini TaxID=1538125 RepID=A0AAV4ST08_9ARAC|nr:hypothetical protein CDAR_601971 [Caerostris darwini]